MDRKSDLKVLACLFGSAGDCLPMLNISRHLDGIGVDVTVAVSELTFRAMGMDQILAGSNVKVTVTPMKSGTALSRSMLSGQYGGLMSAIALDGVIREAADNEGTSAIASLNQTRPHVVMTHPFALAWRRAANVAEIRHVSFELFPAYSRRWNPYAPFPITRQDDQVVRTTWENFDVAWARESLGPAGFPAWLEFSDTSNPTLACATDVAPSGLTANALGLPLGDRLIPAQDPGKSRGPIAAGPRLVVTLGSFLARNRGLFTSLARRCSAAGLPLTVVGASPDQARELESLRCEVSGYMPLTTVLREEDVVVCHGGTGTLHAAVSMGCRSIAVPTALDTLSTSLAFDAAGLAQVVDAQASTEDIVEAVQRAVDAGPLPESTRGRFAPGAALERWTEYLIDTSA